MPSAVDVCNLGLAHLGSDAQVASIDPPDGSAEAGHCARFWPLVRTETMDAGAWSFARARVLLTPVANVSKSWVFAYAVPSDMLNALRILKTLVLLDYGFFPTYGFVSRDEIAVFNERGSANFDIEGSTIFTNEPNAVLLYARDVIDLSRYSPTCIAAMGYFMASYLSGPLINGTEGAQAGARFRQAAMTLMKTAQMQDANNSFEPANDLPLSIRARL